jgi:hypothetical protein
VTTASKYFLSASEVDVHKPFFQYVIAGILIRFGYTDGTPAHLPFVDRLREATLHPRGG